VLDRLIKAASHPLRHQGSDPQHELSNSPTRSVSYPVTNGKILAQIQESSKPLNGSHFSQGSGKMG